MTKLEVKRVYDKAEKSDGIRILVDRLWPRNITKEKAKIDAWAKDITPPRELISWYHEDKEERFKEFEKKYHIYLKENSKTVKDIIGQKGKKTLVTAVKDIEHSHIPTLVRFVEKL